MPPLKRVQADSFPPKPFSLAVRQKKQHCTTIGIYKLQCCFFATKCKRFILSRSGSIFFRKTLKKISTPTLDSILTYFIFYDSGIQKYVTLTVVVDYILNIYLNKHIYLHVFKEE